MPKPSQSEEQKDLTRRRILEAARTLFDGAGIEAVSMRSLGARVGLSAAALYAYFPNKNDLLRALWWDTLDELQARLAELSNKEPDPIEAIRAIASAYVEFALENPARFRVVFKADQGTLANELKNVGIVHDAYRLFRERVAEAIQQDRFRLSDPDLCAQALWAGAHGTIDLINSSASFPFVSPSLLAKTTLDALLAGLSTKE